MSTVNLVDALSGRAKLEGIQWMLRSGAPRRALRRELNALLLAPDMLGPCQLRYARFGPGRKLTAYYDALITEGYCARPVAVTWGSDGNADRHHGTADLAEIQTEAVSHRGAGPFPRLLAGGSGPGRDIAGPAPGARPPPPPRLSATRATGGVGARGP